MTILKTLWSVYIYNISHNASDCLGDTFLKTFCGRLNYIGKAAAELYAFIVWWVNFRVSRSWWYCPFKRCNLRTEFSLYDTFSYKPTPRVIFSGSEHSALWSLVLFWFFFSPKFIQVSFNGWATGKLLVTIQDIFLQDLCKRI